MRCAIKKESNPNTRRLRVAYVQVNQTLGIWSISVPSLLSHYYIIVIYHHLISHLGLSL